MFEAISHGQREAPDYRVVLTLRGILDGEGTLAVRDELEAVAASISGDVVLDLSQVTFMDGSAIAAIGFVFKRMIAKGLRLEITGVAGQPAALLREMGLSRLFALPSRAARRPLFSRPGWALAR